MRKSTFEIVCNLIAISFSIFTTLQIENKSCTSDEFKKQLQKGYKSLYPKTIKD